jgi:hypothetical protein
MLLCQHRPAYFFPLCCLLLLAGCGSGHDASITGTVTLDGTALTTGTVTFHPVAAGAIAYGQIDSQGNYAVKTGRESGLKPGSYVVTVVATGEPSKGMDESPGELLTPARYGNVEQSDLKFEVKAGENKIDIPLTSQPAP